MNIEALRLRDANNPYRLRTMQDYPCVSQVAPMANLTDKYSFIPTTRPLGLLAETGWYPTQVIETKCRKVEKKGFQKHMIRLSNPALVSKLGLTEEIPELVLVNSHSGESSFQLMLGIFRMVCSNGLIAGDTYDARRITHKGYTDDLLLDAVTQVGEQAHRVIENMNQFKSIILNDSERDAYKDAVLELVYDDESKRHVLANDIIKPKRYDDTKLDLWTTYNVAQEKVLGGGIRSRNMQTRRQNRSRAVKSIDTNIKLNKALWSLTARMAEIKGVTLN